MADQSQSLRDALALAREYVEDASQRTYDGTNGHGIREEAKRRLALIDAALASHQEGAHAAETGWRCFHCDEVFTDKEDAERHFGTSEQQSAACEIDITHVRWLEEQNRRNFDEDTEVLRTLRGIIGEHELLRRRAEEEGYARGLADAKKHPEDLGLMVAASPPPPPPTTGGVEQMKEGG